MTKPVCEYPICKFDAEHKCNSCGKIFCLNHIAYYGQQWLCAEDLRKKVDLQKRIATVAFLAAVIGLVMFISGLSTNGGPATCLGFILLTGGLGISSAMGGSYLSVQRSLR